MWRRNPVSPCRPRRKKKKKKETLLSQSDIFRRAQRNFQIEHKLREAEDVSLLMSQCTHAQVVVWGTNRVNHDAKLVVRGRTPYSTTHDAASFHA